MAEKYFQCATIPSLKKRIYFHSFSRCCLPKMQSIAKFREIWTYSSSRSSKVDDFGTSRKRICGFLLVISSNFGPILHRSWDTATYWLKIAYFSYPSHSAPRSLCSVWNFAVKLTTRKLEWWGYLWWKLTDPTVWQTDGQTDERAIAYCALLHMPSRAKKFATFFSCLIPYIHLYSSWATNS